MSEKTEDHDAHSPAAQRKKRLAEQLRANLMRRKAQTRSRRAGEADQRDEGIDVAHKDAGEDEN